MTVAHERPSEAREPARLTILGATGSIGLNTLDIVARNPGAYQLAAVTAHRNVEQLAKIAIDHRAELAVIGDPARYADLKAALAGTSVAAAAGSEALIEAGERPADIVMAAIVGAAGLAPTLAAVRQGNRVALANKECLVAAGHLFMQSVSDTGTALLPVDSEHSGAFQVMDEGARDRIERIVLTASGGPFLDWDLERLKGVTPEQAVDHPTWSMGPKISVDSATLMNKGLELIEAFHLFAVEPDQLDTLIHPQSIVHCLITYDDGSTLAQLSSPDMRTPIAYSLAWPQRMPAPTPRLDLAKIRHLTFAAPDTTRFPALRIARYALERSGGAPTVLNAANEVAVGAFLTGRLGFLSIAALVEDTLNRIDSTSGLETPTSLESVLSLDALSRTVAAELLAVS